MKVSNLGRNVTSTGIANKAEFKIKASAKAFEILGDKLYSDKLGSTIRELFCNAYDSHLAAGNEKTPIEITIPNTLSNEFVIRDYGTGLSDENIYSIYTTYFESTKAETNDFIGGYGLGSKTPFSLVESFQVCSYFNGTKTTYVASLTDSGPSIFTIGSEDTTEANGLEITISTSIGATQFLDSIAKQLSYFPVKPLINGKEWHGWYDLPSTSSEVTADDGARLCLIKDVDHFSTNRQYVVIGNIKYQLKTDFLNDFVKNNYDDYLNGWFNIIHRKFTRNNNILPFIFHLPVGSIELSASRESIAYDDRTIKAITDYYSIFMDTIVVKAKEELTKVFENREYETTFDAVRAYQKDSLDETLTNYIYICAISGHKQFLLDTVDYSPKKGPKLDIHVTYSNKKYGWNPLGKVSNTNESLTKVRNILLSQKDDVGYGICDSTRTTYTMHKFKDANTKLPELIVTTDRVNFNASRVEKYWRDVIQKGHSYVMSLNLWIIYAEDQKMLDKALEQVSNEVPVVTYDEVLEKTRTTSTTKSTGTYTFCSDTADKMISGSDDRTIQSTWNKTSKNNFNFDDGGVYVELSRFVPEFPIESDFADRVFDDHGLLNEKAVLRDLSKIDKWFEVNHIQFVGVNKSNSGNFKKNSNWNEFDPSMINIEQFMNKQITSDMKEYYDHKMAFDYIMINNKFINELYVNLSKRESFNIIKSIDPNNSITKTINKFKELDCKVKDLKDKIDTLTTFHYQLSSLIYRFNYVSNDAKKIIDKLSRHLLDMKEYPMLNEYHDDLKCWFSSTDKKHEKYKLFMDYVSLVDRKELN